MPIRKPKKPPDPKSSHLPHQLPSCFPHIDLSDLPSPYLFYLPPPADVTRLAVIGDVCPRFLAAAEPVVVLASRSWWSYVRSSAWPYQCLPSKPSCSRILVRYGLTLMGNDSLSNPRQVRTTYPLLVRDSLDLGDLISRFWWYGFVLVGYSILVTVCEYCVCRTAILWWLLCVRVVEALNGSVMCLLHACFPEFNLIASEIFFMASSSSSPPVSQSPQNVGHCSAEGSSSPLPRSHKPHSLSSGSYSEALALGGDGKDSKAAQSPRSLPPESHPQPHTASMHTLCLLGKLWGETIPLSVVISKTRKDWGFIKGQVDYLDLGNGWILFRFSNLQDISLVWEGRLEWEWWGDWGLRGMGVSVTQHRMFLIVPDGLLIARVGFSVCWLVICIHLHWLVYLCILLCWLSISLPVPRFLYLPMIMCILAVVVDFIMMYAFSALHYVLLMVLFSLYWQYLLDYVFEIRLPFTCGWFCTAYTPSLETFFECHFLIIILMKMLNIHYTDNGVGTNLFGLKTVCLLSPKLVALYAQNHVIIIAGCWWHQSCCQISGDEVSGFFLLVNEENLSETFVIAVLIVFSDSLIDTQSLLVLCSCNLWFVWCKFMNLKATQKLWIMLTPRKSLWQTGNQRDIIVYYIVDRFFHLQGQSRLYKRRITQCISFMFFSVCTVIWQLLFSKESRLVYVALTVCVVTLNLNAFRLCVVALGWHRWMPTTACHGLEKRLWTILDSLCYIKVLTSISFAFLVLISMLGALDNGRIFLAIWLDGYRPVILLNQLIYQ